MAALLLLIAAPAKSADSDDFERPESLKPAIDFWTRVYGELDTQTGLIHDSRNLGIVYEKFDLNWYDSPSIQDDKIRAAVDRYRETLRSLATEPDAKLNDQQRRVLALWGEGVSADTLNAAATRVRFQRGQADRVRDGIERAGAWEKNIRRILRGHELPEALALLPHVESSYNPHAYSRVGAAGLWQFTRFTGRHYMRVDHIVDERLDPFIASDAAARLLIRYYDSLKSWPLAITAYNHGLSGVRRAVRETGTRDLGEIVERYRGPRFGFASRNYYAAFLAAHDVVNDSERYFGTVPAAEPEPVWIVKTKNFLPVRDVIETLGVDRAELKRLNPSLQAAVWSGSKRVPQGFSLRLPGPLQTVDISTLFTELEGHGEQTPDLVYRVARGDTLSHIAVRYNQTVRDLMSLNNLSSENEILVGQSLRLSVKALPDSIRIASMEALEADGVTVVLPAGETTSATETTAVP